MIGQIYLCNAIAFDDMLMIGRLDKFAKVTQMTAMIQAMISSRKAGDDEDDDESNPDIKSYGIVERHRGWPLVE